MSISRLSVHVSADGQTLSIGASAGGVDAECAAWTAMARVAMEFVRGDLRIDRPSSAVHRHARRACSKADRLERSR